MRTCRHDYWKLVLWQASIGGFIEYTVQRLLFRTPIVLGITVLLYGMVLSYGAGWDCENMCVKHVGQGVQGSDARATNGGVVTEINKESRQNLGVREELIIRNYGFINPLTIHHSDPSYVAALRVAIVELQMVYRALDEEYHLTNSKVPWTSSWAPANLYNPRRFALLGTHTPCMLS
jgi:hypothetical protein